MKGWNYFWCKRFRVVCFKISTPSLFSLSPLWGKFQNKACTEPLTSEIIPLMYNISWANFGSLFFSNDIWGSFWVWFSGKFSGKTYCIATLVTDSPVRPPLLHWNSHSLNCSRSHWAHSSPLHRRSWNRHWCSDCHCHWCPFLCSWGIWEGPRGQSWIEILRTWSGLRSCWSHRCRTMPSSQRATGSTAGWVFNWQKISPKIITLFPTFRYKGKFYSHIEVRFALEVCSINM